MDLLRSYDSDETSSDDSEYAREPLGEKEDKAVCMLTEIKCWQAKRGSYARANVFSWPYSLALTSIFPRDFPFLYETIRWSPKTS